MARTKLECWEVAPSSGSHFELLDGLRGLAILLVICSHHFYVNPALGKTFGFVGGLIHSGWMGVPVFFVLSGFVISYPLFLDRSKNLQSWYRPGYFWRRIAKIIPPFYLSIIIFAGFYWWQFHDPIYLQAAWRWAVGLQSYGLPLTNFNLVYWSLMVEIHFYVLLPILFFLTRGRSLYATTFIVGSFLMIFPLVLRQLAWPSEMSVLPLTKTGNEIRFFLERVPFCVIDYFAFGIIFSGLYSEIKLSAKPAKKLARFGYLGIIMLAFTLGFWAFLFVSYDNILWNVHRWCLETFKYLPAISTFFLLFFVFDRDCLGARLFSLSWLRFIGIVSYEWFLFHGPVQVWFQGLIGHTSGNVTLYLIKTIAPLAITFVLSVAVYRWFSLPILNWVRNMVKRAET